MILKPMPTGAHGRKTRYFIENEDGGTVAHFDSLDTAGLVLRYLMGATMNEADCEAARNAMQRFDEKGDKE